MISRAFSCVVDNSPKYMLQSYFWLESILERVRPQDVFIHLEESAYVVYGDYRQWLKSNGINVVAFKKNQNPFCNKLCQLDTFSNLQYDQIVLMDCDTAIIGTNGINESFPVTETVAAKIVDFGLPQENDVELLFDLFMRVLRWTRPTYYSEIPIFGWKQGRTDMGHCNGGFYIIHKSMIHDLKVLWNYTANRIIESKILARYNGRYVQQLSLTFAMLSLNKEIELLALRWNLPVYNADWLLKHGLLEQFRKRQPQIEDIQIVHYHDQIFADTTGDEVLDRPMSVIRNMVYRNDKPKWFERMWNDRRLYMAK